MKSYTDTRYSREVRKLSISRRHFVASSALSPLLAATGITAFSASSAYANVMEISEDDKVLGDRNAPIGIVEYASLTCPHCATFHNETLPGLEENYIQTGKAYLIYRDFPLDRYAFQAAVLAHSAGPAQYFPVLKILFQQQDNWRLADNPTAELTRIGRMVGISEAKFNEGLANEKLGESILRDRMVGANEYGVSSTPTLFINGEKYTEDRSFETLDAYLKEL